MQTKHGRSKHRVKAMKDMRYRCNCCLGMIESHCVNGCEGVAFRTKGPIASSYDVYDKFEEVDESDGEIHFCRPCAASLHKALNRHVKRLCTPPPD